MMPTATGSLIMGASGPMGTAIAACLRTDGHEVVGVSRSGSSGTEVLDVTDRDAVSQLLFRVRPAVIFYLVRPHIPAEVESAETAIEEAVEALRYVALVAQSAGVDRLLFASTAAVYGTSSPDPLREDASTPAPTPYAQLKLRSERALAEVSASTGLSATALRIFNVYGPGFEGSLVNRLIAAAAGGDTPTVFATDLFVRDYVHVDDVAAAFVAGSTSPSLDGGPINVGTGVGTGNLALLALIPSAPWHGGPILAAPSMSTADISRLREALGVTRLTRLADTLKGVESPAQEPRT